MEAMITKRPTPGCLLVVLASWLAFAPGCELRIPGESGKDSQVGPEIDAATPPTDVQVDATLAPDAAIVEVDSGPDAAIDHSDQLPLGVTPPLFWFWRGITRDNMGWYTDETGRSCAQGDTTMWFWCPGNTAEGCGGAPACDAGHFANPEGQTCTGDDCCWRNWDDPRGPEYRISNASGPIEIHNWGAQGVNGGVPELGFEVTMCALPGTTAFIDTCPRADVYSCVETNAPQLVDGCTTVLLTVDPPPAQYDPSLAGCYSTKADVNFTF
jgi:hypothetical protein